jgi:hypothetical protein
MAQYKATSNENFVPLWIVWVKNVLSFNAGNETCDNQD